MSALAHLMVLMVVNSFMLFVLIILLVSATHSLFINTTMIEAWEIERHDVLVEKARYLGGFVYGPGGKRIRMKRQEFPYDIGIWSNLVQGMGTKNLLAWFLPFGGEPANETGWDFEVNGFEDENVPWPPPDPDKLPREPVSSQQDAGDPFVHRNGDPEGEVEAFKRRQQEDYQRRGIERDNTHSWGLPAGTKEIPSDEDGDDGYYSEGSEGINKKQHWENSDRLRENGVDEESELIEDDDVPLGELLRRRRVLTKE